MPVSCWDYWKTGFYELDKIYSQLIKMMPDVITAMKTKKKRNKY